MWFTRDSAHDEDKKLIQQLSGQFQVFGLQGGIVEGGCWDSSFQWYPSPASATMYWDGHGEPGKDRGFDIRCARLEVMGYNWRPAEAREFVVHGSGEGKASTGCEVHQSWLENQPVIVQAADDGLPHTFRNISHALQVHLQPLEPPSVKAARPVFLPTCWPILLGFGVWRLAKLLSRGTHHLF